MVREKPTLLLSVTLLCWCAWTLPLWADAHLEYQQRGNRYEGIKSIPVSGYDIELISARIDYNEEVTQMPAWLKVKLYLKQPSNVYLTVQELDYKYYYWLDRVQPMGPWPPGFDNVFAWPTHDVIKELRGIRMYDLGVVARLERPEPGRVERVAPVLFYHSQPPVAANGYLFTFKTRGDARLRSLLYQEGAAEPVDTQHFQRQRGGRPFTIRWDSSRSAEGAYKLVVKGYFVETNDAIDLVVHFFHRPAIR